MRRLPARYAKFLASLFGQAVLFSQLSGGFSHITLSQALTAIGVSLGVLAVPNAAKITTDGSPVTKGTITNATVPNSGSPASDPGSRA